MATRVRAESATGRPRTEAVNGPLMAAVVAAGLGSFFVGLFVILSETRVLTAPSLYPPAGGLSGRMAFATVAWLLSWVALHFLWRAREVRVRQALALTLVLIGVGLLLCFPPIWGLL